MYMRSILFFLLFLSNYTKKGIVVVVEVNVAKLLVNRTKNKVILINISGKFNLVFYFLLIFYSGCRSLPINTNFLKFELIGGIYLE